MKKLFAAATVLAAGIASAQSQVTIYGVVDAGLVHESGGPSGARTVMGPGMESGSRLGFRGTEDLGGGMKAVFTLEQGILNDTGALAQGGLAFGRQAFVGIGGNFGLFTLGRQYTPSALTQVKYDPFTTGLAGTSANLLSPGGAGGSNRMNRTVKFSTPGGLAGFAGEIAYAFKDTTGAKPIGSELGFSVSYASGPFSTEFSHHRVQDGGGAGVTGKVTWIAGKYDFGGITGYLNYVVNSNSRVFGILNANSRDILIGLSAQLGSGKLMASFISKNDRTAQNQDAQQLAIGYSYSLSKRTDIYASAAKIRNKNAPIVVGVSGYRVGNATTQGSGNQALSVGIRHVF